MIADIILILLASAAAVTGFRRGFLQTLFPTVGYIGGGVLGLVLSLHFLADVENPVNKFMGIVTAIFLVAELGRRGFGWIAKFFRTKILWAPFRFIDSLAGVALEFIRVAIVAYLLISVVLWSPWASARNAVSESTIYPKLSREMPQILDQLRAEIEKNLSIPKLPIN